MRAPTADHSSALQQPLGSYGQLAGRLLLSAIFLVSGAGKLAAPAATAAYITAMGLPLPMLGVVAAIVIELGAGAAILLGYRTRFAALVLSAFCLVTGVLFHHQLGDQNQLIHLLKNVAIAGGLLQLAAVGGGAISLDRKGRA
jgi:putative oxidoreductase